MLLDYLGTGDSDLFVWETKCSVPNQMKIEASSSFLHHLRSGCMGFPLPLFVPLAVFQCWAEGPKWDGVQICEVPWDSLECDMVPKIRDHYKN